jgi:hypothetical protein
MDTKNDLSAVSTIKVLVQPDEETIKQVTNLKRELVDAVKEDIKTLKKYGLLEKHAAGA